MIPTFTSVVSSVYISCVGMYTGNNPGLPRFKLLITCSKTSDQKLEPGKANILTNSQWHRVYYETVRYIRKTSGKGNVLQILLCAVGFSQQKRAKYWHSLHGEFRTLECPSFTLVLALFKKRGNDTFLSPKRGRGTDRLVTVAVFRQSQQPEY